MQETRVGIVGAGKMGITHCGAFMRVESARVVSACDPDHSKLAVIRSSEWPEVEYYEGRFSPEYIIPEVYTDLTEMLLKSPIDAVIVSTPNVTHYEIVKESLKAGKHVLVEKPAATTYEHALELASIARDKGLVLSVGQCWRFHPHIQYAREIVGSGIIGEIVKFKGFGIHESYVPSSSWFSRKELSGGGALIDMGIHPIDTLRYVLGKAQISHVASSYITAFGSYDVEDVGVALMTMENGAPGIVEFGWANPHTDGVESSIQIFGTKGYLRVFPTSLKLTVAEKKGEFFPKICDWYLTRELYIRQARHFIECIESGVENINSGIDNTETMRIIDALYRSNNEKRVVFLNEYRTI